MLVTLVGHNIVRGCALHTHMPAEDYAHVIIGCLIHDIGYVRGLFKADDEDGCVVDAALPPYHADRSKMFAMERVKGVACSTTTASRAIEGTRFPSTPQRRRAMRRGSGALLRPLT